MKSSSATLPAVFASRRSHNPGCGGRLPGGPRHRFSTLLGHVAKAETGTAHPWSRTGFVWFTVLLLFLSSGTGCVSRTLRFEYGGGTNGTHAVTVRTVSVLSRTSLDTLKEEVQTSEFVSGSLAKGFATRADETALKAIVEGAVRAALSKP
jgi:hypothetical protein